MQLQLKGQFEGKQAEEVEYYSELHLYMMRMMSLVNIASQLQHWRHHFTKVLDVVSLISELVLQSL